MMLLHALVHARRAPGACVRCALAVALAAACSQGPRQREETGEAAGRADSALGHSAVVAQLRSPGDSTRLIYTRPTPLASPATTPAGTGNLGAPDGVSTPDTAHKGARPQPDTSAAHGGGGPGTRPPAH